jgi:hypothetical protein
LWLQSENHDVELDEQQQGEGDGTMKKTTWGAIAAATLALAAAGCNQTASSDSSGGGAVSVAAADLAGATQTASGTFTGAEGHETSGSVGVYRTEAGWVVGLGADFSLDGAPDPIVGFGSGGTYDPASKLGPLQSNTGAQVYALPEGVDVGDYLQVYIWCEEFAIPLGVADLTLL